MRRGLFSTQYRPIFDFYGFKIFDGADLIDSKAKLDAPLVRRTSDSTQLTASLGDILNFEEMNLFLV